MTCIFDLQGGNKALSRRHLTVEEAEEGLQDVAAVRGVLTNVSGLASLPQQDTNSFHSDFVLLII